MKQKPFHNPFGGLKLPDKPQPPAKAPAPAPAERSAATPERQRGLTDDDLWQIAIEGADPLRDRGSVPGGTAEAGTMGGSGGSAAPGAPGSAASDPDVLADDELRALVRGPQRASLELSADRAEGWAPGLDSRLVRKLRRGEIRHEARLDLHGQTRDEARAALARFLLGSRSAGRRCVLVIHGRGLHSDAGEPVLRASLPGWLADGRIAPMVLAFTPARPADGGDGAAYVLLRRA